MTDIEILESTYFDRCTIKRKEKIKNPDTGVTETKEVIITEDAKCALSTHNSDNAMLVDGVGKVMQIHKLFLNPNINLQEGDTVEVSSMGKISVYLASKSFYYSSHMEVIISCTDRV